MAGGLSGRRVVVTRPRERAGPLVAGLEAAGAEVVLFPAIEVVGPADPAPLLEAAARLASFDWLVFTSAYGVLALRKSVPARAIAAGAAGPRVGCVGEATAAAAREAGWEPEVVPEEAGGKALAESLVAAGARAGARVLFPRAEDAREELVEALRSAGAHVTDVVAYRKVAPTEAGLELRHLLESGGVDLLTFTSPSTARNFVGAFEKAAAGVPAVVIGSTTAAAARALGLRVVGVAAESTVEGLVDAAERALEERTEHG